MKPTIFTKKRTRLLCMVLLLGMLVGAVGCAIIPPKKPNIQEVDAEVLLEIKQKYLDLKGSSSMTTDDVTVVQYCGTYNGCVTLILTDQQSIYADFALEESIAGVTIVYPNANRIYAWKNGERYTLEEAYNENLLTKADIEDISYIYSFY